MVRTDALCHLSTSFQEGPHQKLFFHLKETKNYKKAKMNGGLSWMTKFRKRARSLFNGNHGSSWQERSERDTQVCSIEIRNKGGEEEMTGGYFYRYFYRSG